MKIRPTYYILKGASGQQYGEITKVESLAGKLNWYGEVYGGIGRYGKDRKAFTGGLEGMGKAKAWVVRGVRASEKGNKLMNPGKGWIPASFVKVDKAKGKVHILTTKAKNPSTRRQKNIAMGFYDATGFHPIRASEDYDPDRSGDWDDIDDTPRKRVAKKKVAAKKRKKPATKKKATTKRRKR